VVVAALLGTSMRSVAAEPTCAELRSTVIPARAIGLPARGATIVSAEIVAATAATVSPAGTYLSSTPEYCRVLGAIAPVDTSAPPINFQVNLPTRWNG
jgi:feruloyl esterase